jgi:subtilisin family serine protease
MRLRNLLSSTVAATLAALIAFGAPAAQAANATVNIRTDRLALDLMDSRNYIGDQHYGYTAGQGGDGVTIYVIDSGIDPQSPEFTGRNITGENFVPDGRDWTDCWGHGTGVASLAAGNTLGVAPNAKLVALRVFACDGLMSTTDQLLNAIQWVLDHHAPNTPAVVNMSLGSSASTTIDNKVQLLINAGIPVVVSAGNKSRNACGYSPARIPDAITVGNAVIWDVISPAETSNFGSCVDLFAPGTDVDVAALSTESNPYVASSGTSFAAPLVAGVAARYLSAFPSATPRDVSAYVTSTATPGTLSEMPAETANLMAYITDADLRAPETVPGPPRAIETYPYVQCIVLSFSEPIYSGTAHPLLGYTVSLTAKNQKTLTFDLKNNDWDVMSGSSNLCTGVVPGVKYTVTMNGYSALGAGLPTVVNSAYAYGYAAKPANLTATSTNRTTTTVRWTASTTPASLGYAKFVRYEYRTSLDGAAGKKWSAWRSNGSGTTVSLKNLTPGATRLIQVRVITKAEETGKIAQVLNKSPK